jgi:hypothetical protein
MKKTLLLTALALIAIFGVNAQTVWNFSNAPFGPTPTVTFSASFTTPDGLTVGTDGTVLWTGLTANAKTIDGTAYTTRLQTGGGGSPVIGSKIPTTRYLKFNVGGTSSIKIGVGSSSSGAARTIIIVNATQSVVDSITGVDAVATYTYNYTGAASSIYLYSRASGINYYYLSATNILLSGVNQVLTDKGVSFNGTEILNTKGLSLEVYSVLGKKVASSTTSIPTANFQKGVYIVRVSGMNDSLKICI